MTKEEDIQRLERLKQIVLSMPEKPGSYQYYDKNGVIIYVGKAKKLKSRVSSYFHKEVDRFKTKVLVSKIWDISYTVVNTEEDALLLENALIKKYNPRYNVLLKDGKTYPSICVTGEQYPRIFKTRTINKKWGTYYGPYSHLGSMYTILDLIKKLYKPRTCRFPLTQENVKTGKYSPCLEYHIKNCGAPCIDRQSWDDYQQNIAKAREILKGNTRELSKIVYNEMMQCAERMEFEKAEELKQQYMLIDQFCAKSEVVSHTITDVDVFCIDDDDNRQNAFINYMHVTNGTINQSFTYEYKRKLEETDEDLLLQAIIEIRERFGSKAKEIIVPFELDWQMEGAEFFVPQRGDKHHLLELSMMNCKQYRIDRLKQADKLNPEQKYTRLMKELQEKLGLKKLPYRIELFDNSNISGTDAVAGMVVYKGMKKSKQDYRKYNIKTVEGANDYASMQEVTFRRYRDGENLPDLIICDGGVGQMHCVQEIVHGQLGLDIPIAGLAKNDKHRTQELLFLRYDNTTTDNEIKNTTTDYAEDTDYTNSETTEDTDYTDYSNDEAKNTTTDYTDSTDSTNIETTEDTDYTDFSNEEIKNTTTDYAEDTDFSLNTNYLCKSVIHVKTKKQRIETDYTDGTDYSNNEGKNTTTDYTDSTDSTNNKTTENTDYTDYSNDGIKNTTTDYTEDTDFSLNTNYLCKSVISVGTKKQRIETDYTEGTDYTNSETTDYTDGTNYVQKELNGSEELKGLKHENSARNNNRASAEDHKIKSTGEAEIVTVQLKPESELFRALTAMQDEVHRYAISFHRDKRSKHALHSELDDIPGIGTKTRETLLKKYKTVKNLRDAAASGGTEELAPLIGASKAKIIAEHFAASGKM